MTDETKTPKIDTKPAFERFKDIFRPTPISNADEALFDVCMKCGVRLPDKKLATLKEHQKNEHPMTAKEKRSAFVYKHLLPLIFGFMIISMVFAFALPDTIYDPVGKALDFFSGDEVSDIDINACTDRTIELKTRMYEQGEFRSSDANDFNYLLENCNASFWSYRYGDTLFETDYYSAEKIAERNGESVGGSRTIGE